MKRVVPETRASMYRHCRNGQVLGSKQLRLRLSQSYRMPGPPVQDTRIGCPRSYRPADVVIVAGTEAKARATSAFAHGKMILEPDDRFSPAADLDAAWKTCIDVLS